MWHVVMKMTMQHPCSGVNVWVRRIDIEPCGVYEYQITRTHLRKMTSTRIDQELLAILRYRDTKVVHRCLVQIESCRPAKRSGKFSARNPLNVHR